MPFALIAIGIASTLYGLTIMMVRSGSWFFLFWYALGAILIAGGWALNSGFWESLPVAFRRVVEVLGIAFVGFVIVTQVMIVRDINSEGQPDLDCIIVLGAQVREDGPSTALKSRLDAACNYLESNPRTRCIVTGGKGANEPVAEADAMYDYLVNRGISPDRITKEDQALNTKQNLDYSLRFIDPSTERIGIVTSGYHVCRALALARKSGIAHASGISSGSVPWYLPNSLMRESFGLAKDFVFGNL